MNSVSGCWLMGGFSLGATEADVVALVGGFLVIAPGVAQDDGAGEREAAAALRLEVPGRGALRVDDRLPRIGAVPIVHPLRYIADHMDEAEGAEIGRAHV